MKNKSFKHILKYIDWKTEGVTYYLNIDEFNAKFDEFKKTRIEAKNNTIREDFYYEDTYSFSKNGYWLNLYCKEDKEYRKYCCNEYDDNINEQCKKGDYKNPGTKSKSIVSDLFQKYNGCTELKAFGYTEGLSIKRCVPKSIYYINEYYKNKNINHVSKVDYSSNYPSNLVGDLPDWHTRKVVKGTVKPTEEYPFAFYIRSGHVAEYNRFDTHNWIESELNINLFNSKRFNDVSEDRDLTVLCKKSAYNFDKVVDEIYTKKLNEETIDGMSAKGVINMAIGWMHRNDKKTNQKKAGKKLGYRLYHVAAIVIARANQCVLDVYENLRKYGVPVLQVIVDGIIYKSPKPIGVTQKSLGALYQEVVDAQFRMRGVNAYMFFDNDNNFIQERHGAYNTDILTTKLEDIDKWRRVNTCQDEEEK